MISPSKLSILVALAGTVVASPIESATDSSRHGRRAPDGTVEQRKGLSTGAIIAIVVVVVVIVFLFGMAALLLSRRRRRLAKLKADHATTGAPVLNAPGPNYLPPMPERPAHESKTTTTAPAATSQRPQRQPASTGAPQWVPPSAAKTSKVQRPPSPGDAIRFPTPKMPQPSAPKMPQPGFAGGFAVSGYGSPGAGGPAATSSSYPAQPAMREPGFR